MSKTFDVVIVGGAALGSSTAYHLLSDTAFMGRVLVLDKDFSYRLSASALSAASIRQQFSVSLNTRISLYGIEFLREIGDRLEVAGERPDIGLHEGGYLYCSGPDGARRLRANVERQCREGADILYLDPVALKHRFPWLETSDLAAGAWGRTGEGWFDGWALLQAFRRKAKALGAVYGEATVKAIRTDGSRAVGVVLADGSELACNVVVNCAGAGAADLAKTAGIEIPVVAKRRSVFTFACATCLVHCPLLVDPSGAYVRPEGEGFICGISPTADEDPDWHDDDPATQQPDWTLFEDRIWPALARRVPIFETLRPGRAWTGPYDMNLFDHNAIVGPVPGVENFFLCNGFSGHGLQQAPAIGRALAERIVHGRFLTLDLTAMNFERIFTNRLLQENNVI